MTTEEIIRLAFELGSAVAESDEVDRLKALQMKLTQDNHMIAREISGCQKQTG